VSGARMKVEPVFAVQIKDGCGEVERTLHVRKK
jgi:hypothetical protein